MNFVAIARNLSRLGLAVTRSAIGRLRHRGAFTAGVRLGYLEHHAPRPLVLPRAPGTPRTPGGQSG